MLSNPRAGGRACGGCGGATRAHSSYSLPRLYTYDWSIKPWTCQGFPLVLCINTGDVRWGHGVGGGHTRRGVTPALTITYSKCPQEHAQHKLVSGIKSEKIPAGTHMPPFPLQPCVVTWLNRHAHLEELSSAINRWARRSGLASEASVNTRYIRPPPQYRSPRSICPERRTAMRKVTCWPAAI